MYLNISEEKKHRIQEVFQTMKTDNIPGGLCDPEDYSLAKKWLMENKIGVFIDNKWHATDVSVIVKHCCTGEQLAVMPVGNEAALSLAYNTALKASTIWKSDHHVRTDILLNIARNLETEKQLFSLLESIATGKPVWHVRSEEFPLVVQSFYYAASLTTTLLPEMNDWAPLGVAYIMASGYNYPITSLYSQVATALAAGNAVILETDAVSSLSASLLAHAMMKSGLPPGVFSLLPQASPILCNVEIASAKNMKRLFFSGSYEDAEALRRWAISSKCNFELVIHAAYQRPTAIVLDGADVDSAVAGILQQFCRGSPLFKNSGCKVLVQDSLSQVFTKKLKAKFKELQMGSCLSNADISSVILDDKNGVDTVEEITKYGAEVLSLSDPSSSTCLAPSLITNIQTSSAWLAKRVKGSLLIVISFRTMKEAISICNHEKSGCDVSIWCEKAAVALQLAHLLKVANVWVNSQNVFDPAACYGSAYSSGNAVFGGRRAAFQFLEPVLKDGIKGSGDLEPSANKQKSSLNKTVKMYYGGSFQLSDSNSLRKICNCDGEEMYQVPDGSRKDIRNAVEVAVAAQAKWQSKTALSRAQVLFSIAKELKSNAKMFSDLLSVLTTLPEEKCSSEVALSFQRFSYWASMCLNSFGSLQETGLYGKVIQTQEPLGIVGIICPDEFPLLAFVSLAAPLIATGNVAVVVPSEKYPLPALRLCEVFQKCGVPAGVISVITGSSKALTTHLSKHMEVEAIWVHRDCEDCTDVAHSSIVNNKSVWISKERSWEQDQICQEFILRSTYAKTTWLPMGDIFAN